MRWTAGLLLLAAAGCGTSQTKMVACPETGCPESYASSSPQGTRYTPPKAKPAPMPMESTLPPPAPLEPLPDTTPPPPDVPVPSP